MRNTFDYCAWKSVKGPGLWTVKRTRKTDVEYPWCPILHIRGNETPWGIMIKFRNWVDIRGVMTYATCGANRLWRLGVVWFDAINNTTYCQIADLTLSIIKLLTVRSWRSDANTVLCDVLWVSLENIVLWTSMRFFCILNIIYDLTCRKVGYSISNWH